MTMCVSLYPITVCSRQSPPLPAGPQEMTPVDDVLADISVMETTCKENDYKLICGVVRLYRVCRGSGQCDGDTGQ